MTIGVTDQEIFHDQRARAIWQDIFARVTGRSNDLLPFEVVSHAMKAFEQVARPRVQAIPLDRIVGSVGRYKEFTRDFRPRSNLTRDRWVDVKQAMESQTGVPPIEVYGIGDVYFVADGNHRVSVARASGFKLIDANVTAIQVDADLKPGDTLDRAIIKAERANFMTATRLEERVPQADIDFTRPGGFQRLLEHVAVHRQLLNERRPEEAALSIEDAALDWYQNVYRPSVAAIRERRLLRRLPYRTPADLYVWIWGYMLEAYRLFGEDVEPEEAVAMLELRAGSGAGSMIDAWRSRLAYHLGGLLHRRAESDWVTDTFRSEDETTADEQDKC
jgi:hypothetical protein